MANGRSGCRAVILAGGRSARMGTDKAALRLGSETLLQRLARGLAELFDELGVSVARGGAAAYREALVEAVGEGVSFYEDLQPGGGPMEAVRGVLERIAEPAAFFVAVDVPVLSLSAVGRVLARHAAAPADEELRAVVPRWRGRVQPTFALYTRSLLADLRRALRSGPRALRQVADWPRVATVELEPALFACDLADLDPFSGINRREDYEALVELHRSGKLAGPIV